MSLRCKSILLTSVILLSLVSGCIKEENENCTQGINVSFYSKTSCQTDTLYPEQIKDIALCVFDKKGILVAYQRSYDLNLQKYYSQNIEVNSGLYSMVAWSGLDDSHYDLSNLENNVTQKSDLLFRLKRVLHDAISLEGNRVYYGESPAVYVAQASDSKPAFEHTAINLQEITNRLTITVEGLTRAEDYEIEIESDNGSMNLDGTIAQDEVIDYHPTHLVKDEGLEAQFTILKLETGHNSTLIIKNKLDGTEVYRGSLLGTLLLKNPDVNLNCDHDFTVRFTAEDQCECGTYAITEIWVNNWLVHSYNTEM